MKHLSSRLSKVLFGSLALFSHNAFSADLPDMCATQGVSTSITDGTPICFTNNVSAFLSLGGADSHSSVAITTGHGTGDVSLYVDQGRWPSTASNSNAYKSLQLVPTPSAW